MTFLASVPSQQTAHATTDGTTALCGLPVEGITGRVWPGDGTALCRSCSREAAVAAARTPGGPTFGTRQKRPGGM